MEQYLKRIFDIEDANRRLLTKIGRTNRFSTRLEINLTHDSIFIIYRYCVLYIHILESLNYIAAYLMHAYSNKACSHIFGFHFISLPMNETERERGKATEKSGWKAHDFGRREFALNNHGRKF